MWLQLALVVIVAVIFVVRATRTVQRARRRSATGVDQP
ncbi:membrane protein implicated in regulation of membrane protease activity [Saccharomonospora amisosensis]|uniref:Membrane protein implicated in regulation of membrane protease activity n=1 Tax=Saccharomonospora amisosensis TaxID=1128677 RepID=A0A7X5UUR7_9PSEU|nr:membrane protein implicated in regulation of membrane protease activity [Saccharomonospora amisosensis]